MDSDFESQFWVFGLPFLSADCQKQNSFFDADFEFLNDYSLEIFKIKEYKTNKHVFIRKKDE